MDRLTLRVPPDLIRRFDAAAASKGGRSRLLRQLMEQAAQAPFPEPVEATSGRLEAKLGLRLTFADLAALEREAASTVALDDPRLRMDARFVGTGHRLDRC